MTWPCSLLLDISERYVEIYNAMLSVNPNKTTIVLLTKKRKLYELYKGMNLFTNVAKVGMNQKNAWQEIISPFTSMAQKQNLSTFSSAIVKLH